MPQFIPKEIAALNALKLPKSDLQTGTHGVNFTLSISGTVTVGEGEEYAPTASIPLYQVIVLSLMAAGVTDEKQILRLSAKAAEQALEGDAGKVLAAQVEDHVDALREKFAARLPKKHRAGKVTADLVAKKIAKGSAGSERSVRLATAR